MSVDYYDVTEETWCPKSLWIAGGWTIRDGAGGGKRVSAATLAGELKDADFDVAETAMTKMGQTPLFMIRHGEDALDNALAERGYALIDPVQAYTIDVQELTQELPRLACYSLFPPLAVMTGIWAQAGIGPARIEVMSRVKGPKTTIFGRAKDKSAGAAFVAIHKNVAMLHALEVKENRRRQGVAVNMMRAAANWAQDNGARELSVVVTLSNDGGNALYRSLGMKPVGRYHYRIKDPKRA
jgi:ribosomal protein S18 acetylase RimI-like enzyme